MEDVAVYGYITPLKVKIVLALSLTDTIIRDGDVTMVGCLTFAPLSSILIYSQYSQIFKAFHMAYYSAISNPFLKLDASNDASGEHSPSYLVGKSKWKTFRNRVDQISLLVGNPQNQLSVS